MQDVGIFYNHLVYFKAIWYSLWPFGIFYDHLVYFKAIWYILWPFCIFCDHLVYVKAIWYNLRPFGIFSPRFDTLYQVKSVFKCVGRWLRPGMPDGIFLNQKSQFG
jgi:hypothetical protein